jgi:hypothetical protein
MDWKNWLKAAGVRAIKTFAQTCVSLLGGDMVGILQVDWIGILAIGATAAATSLLTSLAGLPEIKNEQK